MPKYKTYNILYFKKKPTGKPFIYNRSMTAKNMKDAKAKQDRINKRWNKIKGTTPYRVKTHKVVKKQVKEIMNYKVSFTRKGKRLKTSTTFSKKNKSKILCSITQ